MKELIKLNREEMKNKRFSQQCKTLLCICAAHDYELAYLHSRCFKKITLPEAQKMVDLFNYFFITDPSKYISPFEFMNNVNEEANKSIEGYLDYEKRVNSFPFDKRVIAGFSKWYAKARLESVMIRLNALYIRRLGITLLEIFVGEADLSKLLNQMKFLSNNKDLPNSFHSGAVKHSFIKAMWKVEEIENKIAARQIGDSK